MKIFFSIFFFIPDFNFLYQLWPFELLSYFFVKKIPLSRRVGYVMGG